MTILCAWAAQDENHRASGGKKGDQTGGEVHTGPWWYFGQNCVIRPKTTALGDKLATIMAALANNNAVGYDQSNRLSLYNELTRLNYDYAQLKKPVECDCSALVAAACNCAGVKVAPNLWTGNLWACLKPSGMFERLDAGKYLTIDKNLKRGDIILNEQTHVIVALENGENLQPAVSSFKVTGLKAPKTLTRGERFVIAGVLKSAAPLVAVEVGVQYKKPDKWVPTAHVVKAVAGSTYNLANADPAIAFRKLPAGDYYFRVYATDKNRTRKRVVNRAFTVMAKRAKKTLQAVADEIYRGTCYLDDFSTWGTGATRKKRLKAAGYTAEEIKKIQQLVNDMLE